MMEQLGRHRTTGYNHTLSFVVEHRHAFTSPGRAGSRRRRGATWMTRLHGKPVRHIEACTFEGIATGEVLVHDLRCCECASAVEIGGRDGYRKNAVGQA